MKQPSLLAHARDILLLPFMVAAVIPWLLSFRGTPLQLPTWLRGVGWSMLGAGLFLFTWTVLLFRWKGKGTLAPWAPTQVLIIRGPYRYCRNPMISGVLLILLGELLLSGIPSIGWEALIFFIINTTYFYFSEEPSMLKRFGPAYEQYCRHVPRWIPRLKPYKDHDHR